MKVEVFKHEDYFWTYFKKILLYIVLTLAFAFVVSLFLGYQYRLVATGSMTPAIPIHSLVVIKPVDYDSLEIGDVVTYKSTNTTGTVYTFTHRVVRKTEDGKIITAGDANIDSSGAPKEDGVIEESRILGKVVGQCYPIGEFIYYFKNNVMACVIAIIIIFLTYIIVS